MWGSEFFNKTLIILLLFFDEREQLLIRKKKSFSIFQNRTCYENVTERFISKLGTSLFWYIFAFFHYQQPKRKFLKNENHFTYVCH